MNNQACDDAATRNPRKAYTDYESSTYTVVSKVAYLIGVQKRIFENEYEPPKMEWYEKLHADKNARIVRNLCMIRTALELNYKAINNRMRFDMCNLHSLPEYVPQDSLNELMPDGLNEKGIKAAAADYYANKNKYPYQVYINWSYMDSGNILYNDKKFVSLLYEANEDYFTDLSKVSDAGNLTKAGIYKFLDKSERVVVVVDCENSDPYKLYATLNNLNQEALLNKICKIILYDDIHTTSAWKILERFTQIPIEHVLIERIKENKSLVDIRLTTGTCREYYQNNVDSFILVSSDSDYWGLISAMPEVRFFVMVESEKCSPTIKNALINAGISYCYIDDFCTGNSNDIKVAAVLREVRQKLDQAFHLNVRDILDEACRATRADMTTAEKNQFYDKYIKTMHVDISPNGEATIVLGK